MGPAGGGAWGGRREGDRGGAVCTRCRRQGTPRGEDWASAACTMAAWLPAVISIASRCDFCTSKDWVRVPVVSHRRRRALNLSLYAAPGIRCSETLTDSQNRCACAEQVAEEDGDGGGVEGCEWILPAAHALPDLLTTPLSVRLNYSRIAGLMLVTRGFYGHRVQAWWRVR
jgi:hypothetical protein